MKFRPTGMGRSCTRSRRKTIAIRAPKPEVTCRPNRRKGSGAKGFQIREPGARNLNPGEVKPSGRPEAEFPEARSRWKCGGRAPTPLPGRDDNRIIRCDHPSPDEETPHCWCGGRKFRSPYMEALT